MALAFPASGLVLNPTNPPTFPQASQFAIGRVRRIGYVGTSFDQNGGYSDCGFTVGTGNATYANAKLYLQAIPQNNDKFTLNGTDVTFVTGTPSGNQVQIVNTTVAANVAALLSFLQASADTNLVALLFAGDPFGGNQIFCWDRTSGTGGNSVAISATGSTALQVSSGTLVGGSTNLANYYGAGPGPTGIAALIIGGFNQTYVKACLPICAGCFNANLSDTSNGYAAGIGIGFMIYNASAQTLQWISPYDVLNNPGKIGAPVKISAGGMFKLPSYTAGLWLMVNINPGVNGANLPKTNTIDQVTLSAANYQESSYLSLLRQWTRNRYNIVGNWGVSSSLVADFACAMQQNALPQGLDMVMLGCPPNDIQSASLTAAQIVDAYCNTGISPTTGRLGLWTMALQQGVLVRQLLLPARWGAEGDYINYTAAKQDLLCAVNRMLKYEAQRFNQQLLGFQGIYLNDPYPATADFLCSGLHTTNTNSSNRTNVANVAGAALALSQYDGLHPGPDCASIIAERDQEILEVVGAPDQAWPQGAMGLGDLQDNSNPGGQAILYQSSQCSGTFAGTGGTASASGMSTMAAWITLTAYSAGNSVISNGCVFFALIGGTTGATAPPAMAPGGTYLDGTVLWQCACGPGAYIGMAQNCTVSRNTGSAITASAFKLVDSAVPRSKGDPLWGSDWQAFLIAGATATESIKLTYSGYVSPSHSWGGADLIHTGDTVLSGVEYAIIGSGCAYLSRDLKIQANAAAKPQLPRTFGGNSATNLATARGWKANRRGVLCTPPWMMDGTESYLFPTTYIWALPQAGATPNGYNAAIVPQYFIACLRNEFVQRLQDAAGALLPINTVFEAAPLWGSAAQTCVTPQS